MPHRQRTNTLALFAMLLLGCSAPQSPAEHTQAPPRDIQGAEDEPREEPSPGWRDPAVAADEGEQLERVAAALEEHGPAIRAQPGVIYVGPSNADGYVALLVSLESQEALRAFEMPDVGVPFTVEVIAETSCERDGETYAHGETFSSGAPDACPDDCTCRYGSITCTLASCRVEILEEVYFQDGSAQIDASHTELINEIAWAMASFPTLSLTLVGHRGPDEAAGLDLERAQAVQAALERAGVPSERLSSAGRADTQPRSLDDPRENLRVEFDVQRP